MLSSSGMAIARLGRQVDAGDSLLLSTLYTGGSPCHLRHVSTPACVVPTPASLRARLPNVFSTLLALS